MSETLQELLEGIRNLSTDSPEGFLASFAALQGLLPVVPEMEAEDRVLNDLLNDIEGRLGNLEKPEEVEGLDQRLNDTQKHHLIGTDHEYCDVDDPIPARGDMIVGDASGFYSHLTKGAAADYILTMVDANDPGWIANAALAQVGTATVKSLVFDIQANNAWADISDTVNLNNCIVIGVGYHDLGAPVAAGDPVDTVSKWWDFEGAAWVGQDDNMPFQTYITGNTGATKSLFQVPWWTDAAAGADFELRVGTDGVIEAQVTNYNARMFVQLGLVIMPSPTDSAIVLD